jgi:catechol 2,3-dioxygenase-like lactoylglutathione lyase family enzyme
VIVEANGKMFSEIYHTGYQTDDMAAAVELLRRLFGGEVIAEMPATDGGKLAYVRAGGAEIEVIEPADKSRLGGRTGLILDHVGYAVEDIDQAIEKLRAEGVRFQSAAPTTNAVGQRMIYLDAATVAGTKMHLTEVGKPKVG